MRGCKNWQKRLQRDRHLLYRFLDDVDGNKEVLKKYEDVKEGVNGGEKIEYGKDF